MAVITVDVDYDKATLRAPGATITIERPSSVGVWEWERFWNQQPSRGNSAIDCGLMPFTKEDGVKNNERRLEFMKENS